MTSRRRISAPKLRGQHCIGSNEYFDRAQLGTKTMPQCTANVGDGPERSHVSFRQLLRTYQRTRVQQLCADIVAKVPNGPALIFLLQKNPTDDRGSMWPQSRYRGRQRVYLHAMRSPPSLHENRVYSQKKF